MKSALGLVMSRSSVRPAPFPIHDGAVRQLLEHGARAGAPIDHRIRSIWLDVEGVRMHAAVGGPSPDGNHLPVVLVHGFGVSGRYFVPTAWRLARHFPVYVPDLPGHGQSDLAGSVLDVSGLADALVAWLDAAGLPRVVLVGNSYGCQISARAALRHPGRVAALVFIGPTLEPRYRPLHILLPRFLAAVPHERPSIIPMQIVEFFRFGLHRLPRELAYMTRDRMEDVLPRITVPVLTVRGARDQVVSERWAERVTALCRGGRLAVLDGRGHALNYSAPASLVRTMLPFLHEVAAMPFVRGRARVRHRVGA